MSSYKANHGLEFAIQGKRKNPLIDDIIHKGALAECLGCTEQTITYYQKQLGLPFIPVGRDTYFSIKSIYKWLLEREQTLLAEKELKKEAKGKTSKGLVE